MRIAIGFDGVLVEDDGPYEDLSTSLRLKPGAKAALEALKRAGHLLLLYSARAARAAIYNPGLDPFVRAGVVPLPPDEALLPARELAARRWRQMLRFVEAELPGVFDAVDDGAGGIPLVDLFIDARVVELGAGALQTGWPRVAARYGAPVVAAD